jgi:hypothetical protein
VGVVGAFGPVHRGQGADELVSGVEVAAIAARAAASLGGSLRSRLLARSMIPRAALGLNEYFGSTFFSRTCDNKHATASLGHSEPSSVKQPPDGGSVGSDAHSAGSPPVLGHFGPRSGEPPQHGGEVPAVVGGQSASDVLPENPTGSRLSSDTALVPEQSAPLPIQAFTSSSHGEVLARASPANSVNSSSVLMAVEFGDVAVDGGVGPVVAEHRLALLVDFAVGDDGVAGGFDTPVEAADP